VSWKSSVWAVVHNECQALVASAATRGDVTADCVSVNSDLSEGAFGVHLFEGIPAGAV